MSLTSGWFPWLGSKTPVSEFPEIFPLSVKHADFVDVDVQTIYTRILTDVIERTQGLTEDELSLLWDNCLGSELQDGLITLLAKAMSKKAELCIVYDSTVGVIRKATALEAEKIKADYKTQSESPDGVYITFKEYKRTDFVKLYSAFEYSNVASLYKQTNLAAAIQLKFKGLRGDVGLGDSADVTAQMVLIAKGLAAGKSVGIDGEDTIETAKPDLTASETANKFIQEKRSFYLGLPASWITGMSKNSMGDTGEGDRVKVEQGLKGYFVSIVKPVVKAIFDKDVTFKSEDFRQLTAALEAMKTFELTGEEFMSSENKLKLINKLFGFAEDTKGGELPVAPPKLPPPVPPPVV